MKLSQIDQKFDFLCFLPNTKTLRKAQLLSGKLSNRQLLGNIFDRNINFKRQIENVCSKGNNKTEALPYQKFLNLEQAQILAKANILFYFKYYH